MMTSKEIIEKIKDSQNQTRLKMDFDRFEVYNGKLKNVVKEAIKKEFSQPETIDELINRIIPINITQKIINKLAMIYMQPPMRMSADSNDLDDALLDQHASVMKISMNGKIANRYVKLFKHCAWMPYLDSQGVPRLRTLPSHTYTPLSDDPKEPHKPTIFVKHLKMASDPKQQRFSIWTKDEFRVVDGYGVTDRDEMLRLDNPEGVNPFGVIPFTYIAEQDDLNLIPISDDDLISMQVAICILLTDLAFASKYQLWSIYVITGADGSQKITLNPNSVVQLPEGATLQTVKPQIDIDKSLNQIETLISLLLTTKNLSVGDISGMVRAQGSSGIAKMIDRSETTEDRKDQQEMFIDAEKRFWESYAYNILPYWVQSGQINQEYVGRFSDTFELSIRFADPKPFIGDKETVELEVMKLQNHLTTKKRALRSVHPDLGTDEIEDLQELIEKNKKEQMQEAERMLNLNGDQTPKI